MAILEKAPEGAQVLDLGAARAARAEARVGQPRSVIRLSVGFVELKAELDVLCAEDFAASRISDGLRRVVADPADLAELVKGGLTAEDLQAIVEFVTGNSLGE
ncbi:hypothetical protein [Glaciihabitans sp. UYNi722]|uniref:hypothetical protein n=1 Tax=Glaciihabitans sp. UYNi722 TaxID=3156344 RepID=UPI003396CFA6